MLITLIVMDRLFAAVRAGVYRVQYATRARNSHMTIVIMVSNAYQGAAMPKCALP